MTVLVEYWFVIWFDVDGRFLPFLKMDTKYSILVLKIWADTYMDTCQTKQSDFFYACKNVSYSSRLKNLTFILFGQSTRMHKTALKLLKHPNNDQYYKVAIVKLFTQHNWIQIRLAFFSKSCWVFFKLVKGERNESK